jgi:hypothetical protein
MGFPCFSEPICLTFKSWRSLGGFSSQSGPHFWANPISINQRAKALVEQHALSLGRHLDSLTSIPGWSRELRTVRMVQIHTERATYQIKNKKCTPDTMFSQSTTIHYNPLRHAELSPAMLFKTYGACGCNRHQRPRVRAGGAREEPHPVGFQGIHLGWESLPQTSEYQKAWQSESHRKSII